MMAGSEEAAGTTRSTKQRPHRVIGLIVVVAVAVVSTACGSDSEDRATDRATTVVTSPSIKTSVPSELPIGADDSPYWVAHDLPTGYEIVVAQVRENPPVGQPMQPMPSTRYNEASEGTDDSALGVSTIRWAPTNDERAEFEKETKADPEFDPVTVRGKRGYRYPLSGDGRTYGTTLLWEERPGLWILVEAADPLPADTAFTVAEGLQPFPEDRWDDLILGLESGWWYQRPAVGESAVDEATAVSVGRGASGGVSWSLEARIPPRWGDLPAERRYPCATLTVGGHAMPDPTCDDHPGWYDVDGQVFLVGLAPAEVEAVTITTSASVVEAEIFQIPETPAVQYWVGALGPIGCEEVEVNVEPAGLTDALVRHMTRGVGPAGGCG